MLTNHILCFREWLMTNIWYTKWKKMLDNLFLFIPSFLRLFSERHLSLFLRTFGFLCRNFYHMLLQYPDSHIYFPTRFWHSQYVTYILSCLFCWQYCILLQLMASPSFLPPFTIFFNSILWACHLHSSIQVSYVVKIMCTSRYAHISYITQIYW